MEYDSERRVPFLNNPAYERDEYDWWILNTGEPSNLFLNGVFQSQETGTNDLGLVEAWLEQPDASGIKVGIVDYANAHGLRCADLVSKVAPGCEVQFMGIDEGLDFFAKNIYWLSTNGCHVIILTWGTSSPDTALSNACRFAESQRVIICCAVPNVDGNLDAELVDYPYRWAHEMNNLLPVTSTDRNGNHYSPSGVGTNAVAAPGRNIVANGNYSSGTSWATPIVAGCAALAIANHPKRNAAWIVNRLQSTATPNPPISRVNPVQALHHH